jgi:hypothetical protein
MGEWRKLHNEELRDLYSSPSIIRTISLRRWDGRACRTNGDKRNACRFLVGKSDRKRPLRKPRNR